ncbi:tRNA-dihydrouridine synthase [Candidatus Saccharibacteria bacterium]|nr:tRNA-dihydrouridine synthase [Candidatus Saccharibacteria bacterium]MBI3337705.1 tRNA-dihydrouridine synthase [Candidatus Saccharibacteria bacterium]
MGKNKIILPKPFFVLAPMDDVTDTVFRQVIAGCAPPDVFFTEFVNVDALQSAGRTATLPRLLHTPAEKPLIAQIWGKTPENYYKSAQDMVAMGFDGIDINMGCPVKDVVRNGCCSALINNRGLAAEIIQATKDGAGSLPISVKTRLGYHNIDYSWHEFLFEQNLNALSIHGRTRKQMSKVPANWEAIGEIVKLRDKISPTTKIIGNGDVSTRAQGMELAARYSLDGIMIGRGVFNNPFVFSSEDIWQTYSPRQRKDLYAKHVKLFAKTWKNNEKPLVVLNKFCKIYINGFDGAKELREKLMQTKTTNELLALL